jgi:hypothetical protein
MAADSVQHSDSNAAQIEVHARNYAGFLTILRRSTIAVAIIAAIVVYIIAN